MGGFLEVGTCKNCSRSVGYNNFQTKVALLVFVKNVASFLPRPCIVIPKNMMSS